MPEREAARLGLGADVPRVETRRVGPHGSHPDRDRVGGCAQLVHAAPRLLARDPAATGNRDPSVERRRGFVGDEGPAEGLPDAPGLVLPARVEIVEQLDLDTCATDSIEPASIHQRVRIAGADHDARHSRRHDRVGARRRATVMRARLERHVEGRAARCVARLLERDRLGVPDSVVGVPALPHDLAVSHDDRADKRIVAGLAASLLGQFERAEEVTHVTDCTRLRYESVRSPRPKTAEPATSRDAPASCAGPIVSGSIPPSTWT